MNNSNNSFSRNRSFSRDSGQRNQSRDWRSSGGSGGNYHRDKRNPNRSSQNSGRSNPNNRNTGFNNTLQNNDPQKGVPALASNTLRILPLGGQGELGRNCWVLEYGEEIIIIDAGLGFMPHGFKGGADLLLPNFEYLTEHKSKIKALIISNAHEEYAGALPNFIKELELKEIYLPKLAKEVYQTQIPPEVQVKTIAAQETYQISQYFTVRPFIMSFSTVDAYAFLINTPQKKVFYTGAFKIDHTPPIPAAKFELNRIAQEISKEGVDILISNSHNVETPGYTASASSVQKKTSEVLSQVVSRAIAIIGCSNIQRMQVLLDVAKEQGFKVCLIGKETKAWLEAAQKAAHLQFSPDLLDHQNAPKTLFIIGSEEGNILKPFIDLAYKRHPELTLEEDDAILVSANPPLGTSRTLANAVDQLFVQGVKVIGGRDAGLHVQGYAAQEELKFMYNLTRPKHFIPAQGEARQLVLHAELLNQCGMNPQNVIILDNGNVIDLGPEQVKVVGKVATNPVFFNSEIESPLDKQSLEERRSLSEDGTITTLVSLNFAESKLVAGPIIKTMGSSFNTNKNWLKIEQNLLKDTQNAVEKALKQGHKEVGIIRHLIHDILNRRIREHFGMSKPLISIMIQEVR